MELGVGNGEIRGLNSGLGVLTGGMDSGLGISRLKVGLRAGSGAPAHALARVWPGD